MNPDLCRVALRPRGPLEVFDLSLSLCRAHLAVFARLAAWLVLPLALALGAGAALTAGHWAWLAAALALSPLLQAPFTLLGGRLLFNEKTTAGQVVRELLQRPISLLAIPFWYSFVALLGLLSCGVAAFLMPAMVFVTEAALLERADGTRIPRRATKLAALHPGIAIAASVGWLLSTIWWALVGEGLGQAVVGTVLQIGQPFGTLSDGVVTPYLLAGVLFAQPLFGIYRLLLFVDVRTRVDAWDLQVGLRAAGLEAERRSGKPDMIAVPERRAGGMLR